MIKIIVDMEPEFSIEHGYSTKAEFDIHDEATSHDVFNAMIDALHLAGYGTIDGNSFIEFGEQMNWENGVNQPDEE